MNDYSLKISNHELNEECRRDAVPYMEKIIGVKSSSPSELAKYSFTVMSWMQRLRSCFTSLEHTRVYMRHFRNNKWYREAGIVQGNYINYHYAKYTITVVTIMDVSLILTNYTFRLGNPERLCSLDNITRNSWVISTNIGEALNKLSRIVEPWREPRNLFIHRGWEMYSELLTALEQYELTRDKGMLDEVVSSHRVKSLYKSELSDIFKEFDEVEAPLFEAVIELLSELLPIYESWRNRLQTPPMENS
jgi:hypothetical protein